MSETAASMILNIYVSSLSDKIMLIPNSCLWQEMEEVETGKQPKKNPLTFSILSAVS